MLPSRLFRNTGISPRLRSLLTPSPSLPATLSTQLRFYLAVRHLSSSKPPPPSPSSLPSPPSPGLTISQSIPLEPIEPRLSLTFTCTVTDCGERSTHQFTKRSYEKGIVLIECPGCKNRCVDLLINQHRCSIPAWMCSQFLQASHCRSPRLV